MTDSWHACSWLLSGTPIQNSVADLYSYFRFLQWKPFNNQTVFKKQIQEPVKANQEKAYKKLQGILQGVLLRRTKHSTLEGKPILDIPKCEQRLERIEFEASERQFYDKLLAESQSVLAGLQASGGCVHCSAAVLQALRHGGACSLHVGLHHVMHPHQFISMRSSTSVALRQPSEPCRRAYLNALAQLMRLRQACCHPALVRSSGQQKAATAAELDAARALPAEERLKLLSALVGPTAQTACAACDDIPDDPVVAPCGHVVCRYVAPTCAPAV